MSARRWIIACMLSAFLNSSAADFGREIAPILMSECLACHSSEKAKGGYRVHTFAAVLQAGKSEKPAVVPGQPEESELFQRLVTHDEDDRMPQEDEPLSSAQIELFRAWIASGAKLDHGDPQATLAILAPRMPHRPPPEFYTRPLPVLALAFTSAGSQIAVGGYHEITIWNLQGQLEQRVTNAPQRIHAITFAPTGNLLALAGGKPGRSGELSVYQNGQFLTNLARSSDEMLTAAFSPDGKLLACGGADNAIRIFQTDNWQPLVTIQQHADWVTSVAFNQDGQKLVSASRDRTARVYDAASAELETTYVPHGAPVFAAVFFPEENLASAGRDKEIHLWDIKEGKKRNGISGAGAEIYELIATDKFLFAASGDKQVRQYAVEDRKLIRAYTGHEDAVYALSFSSAHSRLATGSYDGIVKIWNTNDGSLVASFAAAPLKIDPAKTSNR